MNGKKRGFSVLETTLGTAIFVAVSGAVMGLAATGQGLYTESQHHQSAAGRANALMDRIFSELRHASIEGEDIQGVDDLDIEDTNGNGRLDADFSLEDGDTASRISFNVARGAGLVSTKIEIGLINGKVLHRVGATNVRRSVLARDVKALTFTRQGRRIIVNVITRSGITGDGDNGKARGGKKINLVREILIRN